MPVTQIKAEKVIHCHQTQELIVSVVFPVFTEEAEAMHGKDKIKIYQSTFTNMYHAVTTRKTSTKMKLVCLLPNEKVNSKSFQPFISFRALYIVD